MALMPPMLQGLMGYSVFGAGLLMMWRGLGSFGAMFVVGRMVGRVDTRLILGAGLGLSSIALLQMSHFDLVMGGMPFITSGIIQGVGIGLIFVPLSVLAFATLDPALRAEATSVYTLVRSLGSAVGISMMQALFTNRAAVSHADMAAQVQPGNPANALARRRRRTDLAQRGDLAAGGHGRLHRRLPPDAVHDAGGDAAAVHHAPAPARAQSVGGGR